MPEKLADFYNEMTMSEQKFKKLDQAIKKEPNEPWYYWMKAEFQTITGQDAEAIQNYEKSISVDPKFDAGHGSLARHLYLSDSTQLDKALIHINKAIEIKPSESYYLIDRATIYLKMRDYQQAMRDVNLAYKADGNSMEVQKTRIEVLYYSGVKEELHQFVNENDLSEEVLFLGTEFTLLLASIYEEMGQLDKACMLFRGEVESYLMFDDEIPGHLAEKLKKCE